MSPRRELGANYQVGERVGAGASGIVHKGIDKRNGEPVAIKFLREQYRQDPLVLSRFVSERTLLTAIVHPRIVRVRDLVAEDGQLAIIMDYLPGTTLATYLAHHGTVAPHLALTITSQILAGLAHAHSENLIHRDIKPDNVILTQPDNPADPGVVITDFGIASILGSTHSSMTATVGTAHYMAPELIKDATIAASVDLYAVGITCYQMLTATTPFDTLDEANAFTIAHRHLTLAPPPIKGARPKTSKLLDALLAKTPQPRANVDLIRPLLQEALEESVGQAALPAASLGPTSYHKATVLKPEANPTPDAPTTPPDPNPPAINSPRRLPAANTATIIKPQPVTSETAIQAEVQETPDQLGNWKRPTILISAAIVLTLLTALFVWYTWPKSAPNSHTHSVLEANFDDPVLASGLKITRNAKWNSESHAITYTITYSSIRTPIQGQVMEILSNKDGSCLTPNWKPSQPEITTASHSLAMTSIKAECAWTITLPAITQTPLNITTTITPNAEPKSQTDLQSWLAQQSGEATKALGDPHTTSTAYPLQRLSAIRLEAPQRVTQGSVIPITIIGIWPSGPNTVTPIYTSPTTNDPTSIAEDITAADMTLVRFNDRCSGALSITPNGHEVTALYPTTTCTIEAQVGNYETASTPINITNSGS